MSAPAAFARALLAAHYLLPFCGLRTSTRDSVAARLVYAARAAGLDLERPAEALTLTILETPEARLEALRDHFDLALFHAPDAAYPEVERAVLHLPRESAPAAPAAVEGGA